MNEEQKKQTRNTIKRGANGGRFHANALCLAEELLAAQEDRVLRWNLAECYKNKGNFGKAVEHLYKVLELEPKDDAYTWGRIGTLELKRKAFAAAEHAFKQEAEKAPDRYKYLAKMGIAKVAAAKNDYWGAVRIINDTLQQHPEAQQDRLVHTLKASILRSVGRFDEAQDCLDAANAIGRRGRDDALPRQQRFVDRGLERKNWGQGRDDDAERGRR